MFLSHFVRGLRFPVHPFVLGLMFYYGLDFHDLAPNFILNILAFIVVCKAFLRIKRQFGLWLKIFNVKLNSGWPASGVLGRHGGQDAQCHLARRLLCGDCEGVAIRVVLHHRATRHPLGGDP